MPASFPSSFVRFTETESLSTAAKTAMGVNLPPWLRPHQLQDNDPLPRSLYPVLPPPTHYMQVQPVPVSRSPSNTGAEYDTVMTDAESEDLDGVPLEASHPSFKNFTFQRDTSTNYLDRREDSVSEFQADEDEDDSSRFDYEYAEETVAVAKPARTRSTQGKKNALKVADAIKKCSKKASAKNTKSQKEAPASGSQNAPARRTRSSARSQPAAPQPAITESGDEITQPTEKNKTRKTWLPWERKLLRHALVSWWTAEGAARFNHETKMVLPNPKDVTAWEWFTAECKALNGAFNRVPGGVYIVAGNMRDDLPRVSVPGDSTAGRRRH